MTPVRAMSVVLASVAALAVVSAQEQVQPTNDAPNPYDTVEGWARMPPGREWGSTSAVDIAPDGVSVWVAERCADNRCYDTQTGELSPLDVVFLFDEDGNLVRSFGQGRFASPHGIHVDREGNVWVTDWQTNVLGAGRGRGRGAEAGPPPPPPATIVGYQVQKFSPTGELLMAMGRPGGDRPAEGDDDPESFYQPNDVITNDAGEIFVAEGHSSGQTAHAKISKFDRNGRFITSWGSFGTAPGQFDQPHGLAFDSQGRLFVADRGNNRIQIFDQDGTLLECCWTQYSRLSGIWIDENDMLYGADSESGSVAPERADWTRGIRIGSVRDGITGRIRAFIPDPFVPPAGESARGTLAAEGVAVDRNGVIYGAEVGPRALKRYVRRR
jgi:sugar lactone lactonase YvrE